MLVKCNMFSEYIQAALMQAEYDTLEDGSYVATVPGLQGVIAVGRHSRRMSHGSH